MSEENVQIVRDHYERLDRALAEYWAVPDRSVESVLERPELWELVHEDVEWKPTFSPERFKGHEGVRRATSDWLEAADDWRISLEDAEAGANDRVLATVTIRMRGKGSGLTVEQRAFMVVGLRDQKISTMAGFVEREEALEAAGLSE